MDLTMLILAPLLAQLKPLLAGVLVAVFAQVAKKSDAVKFIPEDNVGRVKAFARFLSFLAAVLVAWSDGNLSSIDWSVAANVIADFAIVALTSAGTWAVALKGRNLLGK